VLRTEGPPAPQPGTPSSRERGTDDAALIAASVRDPELFALVYDRHAAVLYGFAARRLGPGLAEDAVSDTMLAALTIRHRYNPERPDARPWLLGILTREISHHRRTERNRYQTLSRTPHDRDAQDSPADRVAAQVTAASVRGPLAGALATLATRDRDVLLLVAWADLSYAEVADALAVPIGTVRSRLNRARRQIRKALPDLHLSLADETADETTADKDMS
jgi:RNA polymerase sigma-70 factor (ECF subfamily)